jgi:hypothetical protein
MMLSNPFAVISPEDMTAEEANQFFVEMHSDFDQIERPGNVIITGARGCGKSMLIRCSLPDVLMLKDKKMFSELDHLSICVPVKKTSLNITDFQSTDKRAPYLINEHFMAIYVLMYSLLSLSKIEDLPYKPEHKEAYEKFFNSTYKKYMILNGCNEDIKTDYSSPNKFFLSLYNHAEELQFKAMDGYINKLSLNIGATDVSYNLPLLSFLRFIYPVFKELINLPGFPREKSIYLFIDDADNLSTIQTEILNSWIVYRTQPSISLKVSTQIGMYKTYLTPTEVLIESPHDYQNIDISYTYTTNITNGKFNYHDKASKILEKRLNMAKIRISPNEFFPICKSQENKIKDVTNELQKSNERRVYSIVDTDKQYDIPNYIKYLQTNKALPAYQYAGLSTIIHLSSGIIRYLLDVTTKMYDAKLSRLEDKTTPIKYIDTNIQDNIMREQADHLLYTELKKLNQPNSDSFDIETINGPKNDTEKLQNLISAMGHTFHEALVSDRSEREIFSIALSNIPDQELKNVFQLGVRLGFFHEKRIGNKDGTGKTMLYILNRCFSPLFTLAPTGFLAYLFMTNEDLYKAIRDGKKLRNIDGDYDPRQLSFDDILED